MNYEKLEKLRLLYANEVSENMSVDELRQYVFDDEYAFACYQPENDLIGICEERYPHLLEKLK